MRVCFISFTFSHYFQLPLIYLMPTDLGTNGTTNGTLDTTATKTNGGMWEAVLFMGGSLLLVTLLCGAVLWFMMQWMDEPVSLGSTSHTARVEL